jgi:hypothetical protein
MNAEGETGFSYIRIQTASGIAEGFIRSCYLALRVLDASVAALAAVHRGDLNDSAYRFFQGGKTEFKPDLVAFEQPPATGVLMLFNDVSVVQRRVTLLLQATARRPPFCGGALTTADTTACGWTAGTASPTVILFKCCG